jgi:predicted nucleic acid-binding protein
MKVVDSTFLISHARGEQVVSDYLTEHSNETIVVPTIAFQELAVGEVLARDKSKQAICRDLGPFSVRPFTNDHAYHAAQIEATLREQGDYDPVLKSDILIGAVGRSLGIPVVTRNTDDFTLFAGVTVETY